MNNKQGKDNHFKKITAKGNMEKQRFQVVQNENAVENEFEPNNIPVFHQPKKKKKRKNSVFLVVLVTILAASVIGILLGMGALQMFIIMEDNPAVSGDTQEVTQPIVNVESNLFQLTQLSGYVLQAGVFSEKENALEWQDNFIGNEIPAVIWERDNQYFLFVGIYETEELAKISATKFESEQLELFTKPWETVEKELEITAVEEEWLTQFQELWSTTISVKDPTAFTNLLEALPDSKYLEHISSYLSSGQVENVEQFYLDLFYLYEQVGKDQ